MDRWKMEAGGCLEEGGRIKRSGRTNRHYRIAVGHPHPMESALGRIEIRASAGSLSARKTHGDEHCERDAPCLYLPDGEHTSRVGNPGNPWQTRHRLGYRTPPPVFSQVLI